MPGKLREIARSRGAKVPPTPQAAGYCSVHGMAHVGGSCNYGAPDALAEANAAAGGTNAAVARPAPFKLGGGQ